MRIVLEKSDLIKIVGKYLEAELDPSRVVVRTDPFEVEVTGIPLNDPSLGEAPAPAPAPAPVKLAAPPPTSTPPGPTRVGVFTVTPPELPSNPDESIVEERSERNASTEMPPFDEIEGVGSSTANANPAGILAISKSLQDSLDRENPNLVAQRKRLLNAQGQPIGSEEMPAFTEGES